MYHSIIIRQVVALILMALGTLIVCMNWLMVVQTSRTGRSHSTVPLVGAGCLGVGLLLLPETRHYAWVALLLDFGTLFLLMCIPRILLEEWKTSRFNLVAEYGGGRGNLTARIHLYRRGLFVIQHQLNRPPGELGTVGRSMIGTWSRDEQALTLEVGDNSALFNVESTDEAELLRQVTGFSHETESEMSLAGVELRRKEH